VRYPITASARNTKRFVVVFKFSFIYLFIFLVLFFFFSQDISHNRSAATCGGGYRRCSSCVLIDAYKVLECGQHLNQSMVPLMLNARDSFRVLSIKLPSLRETTLSLGVVFSSAYLSFLAFLSLSSFLPLSALSLGLPSLFRFLSVVHP